jgi:hypothetical protein
LTSGILSPAPNLQQDFCEKSRKKVCFTDLDEKTRRKNTALYRKLDKIPQIRDAMKSLVIDNDPEAERLDREIPKFDWIRYLYHNNAILKNGTAGAEKSYKIIAWRRVVLFLILLHTESQRHGFCYAMTPKLLEILQNQGYPIKIRTIYNDIRYLESQGFIFRNTWKKTKYIGGGSVRHIITAYNVESYRKNYIEQINIRGIGKPQSLKDRFSEYAQNVSKLLFCSSIADKNISPQEYIHNYYINTPPCKKIARKSRKRERERARKLEARVPETQNPPKQSAPWDPARLNDAQWVVQEAIHQGCDGTLARQIVEAIQIKQIPLKTNLLRATLHATKSRNQEYINAISTVTEPDRERKRKNPDRVHDVSPSGSGVFTDQLNSPGFRELLQSRNISALQEKWRDEKMAELANCRAKFGSDREIWRS